MHTTRRIERGQAVRLARQPIFDRAGQVLGYELLFRGDPDVDPTEATMRVLADSAMAIDVPTLTGGRPAFVNVTEGSRCSTRSSRCHSPTR